MRFGKAVRILIPVGTLLGLGIAWSTLRMVGTQPDAWSAPSLQPPTLEPLAVTKFTRTLEGVVLDAASRPLADALVFARGGDVPAWCLSDKEGRFRLESLPAGELRVHLVAQGQVPCTRQLDADVTQAVLRVEQSLGPPPVLDRRTPTRVSGRVVARSDADGADKSLLGGLEVLLLPVENARIDPPPPARARTDAAGRFVFEALFPGRYRVMVLPDWARSSVGPDLLQSIAGTSGERELEHEQERGDLTLDLALGVLDLECRDAQGVPQEGVLVLLRGNGALREWWPAVSTDAGGRLRIAPLPPDEYRLELQAGSWQTVRSLNVGPDQYLRERIVCGGPAAGKESGQ
ncbi:MAG: carboxypeptidase regulatory-like domain-containing protein [Planctomycetia bacterium]